MPPRGGRGGGRVSAHLLSFFPRSSRASPQQAAELLRLALQRCPRRGAVVKHVARRTYVPRLETERSWHTSYPCSLNNPRQLLICPPATHAHTHTHTHSSSALLPHMHTHTHTHTHTHAQHTHTHAQHMHMHARTCTCTCTCTHVHVHIPPGSARG